MRKPAVNPYESLRRDGNAISPRVSSPDKVITITGEGEEMVSLMLQKTEAGWIYGYYIRYRFGRPSARGHISVGFFNSGRDAQLYFFGRMLQWRVYFSEKIIYEVKRRVASMLQQSLF